MKIQLIRKEIYDDVGITNSYIFGNPWIIFEGYNILEIQKILVQIKLQKRKIQQ